MGMRAVVVKQAETTEKGTGTRTVSPLPKRATAPVDRAPVLLADKGEFMGHAITVPGEPSYARVMRRHLRTLASLPVWEAGPVELLASELFNNCVHHTRSGQAGGEITISVCKLEGRTQVRVTDVGPRQGEVTVPCLRPFDPEAEGGRGLRLVAEGADRWGTVHHDDGRTSVWFEVDRIERRSDQHAEHVGHVQR